MCYRFQCYLCRVEEGALKVKVGSNCLFIVLYDAPLHGYALIDAINILLAGRKTIKPRSLSTMLKRLKKEDLHSSEWNKSLSCLENGAYLLPEAGMDKLIESRIGVKEQKMALNETTSFYENKFTEREKDDGN